MAGGRQETASTRVGLFDLEKGKLGDKVFGQLDGLDRLIKGGQTGGLGFLLLLACVLACMLVCITYPLDLMILSRPFGRYVRWLV